MRDKTGKGTIYPDFSGALGERIDMCLAKGMELIDIAELNEANVVYIKNDIASIKK
jgi:hypothetical protein